MGFHHKVRCCGILVCILAYSGLLNNTGAKALERGSFASGTGPIYLSNLNCDGNELSLLDCLRLNSQPTGLHNCEHSEDVSVQCTGN